MLTLKPLFAYLAYYGISLKEFSEKTGISKARLSTMKNKGSFTAEELDIICTALRLNIKDIMRYDFE